MFSARIAPLEFANLTVTCQFRLVFEENSVKELKSHSYRDHNVSKSFVFETIFPHENEKRVFSKSSGLKGVFEKLSFRDGLVWTVGLTMEIKLLFQISSVQFGCCLNWSFLSVSECVSIRRYHLRRPVNSGLVLHPSTNGASIYAARSLRFLNRARDFDHRIFWKLAHLIRHIKRKEFRNLNTPRIVDSQEVACLPWP